MELTGLWFRDLSHGRDETGSAGVEYMRITGETRLLPSTDRGFDSFTRPSLFWVREIKMLVAFALFWLGLVLVVAHGPRLR